MKINHHVTHLLISATHSPRLRSALLTLALLVLVLGVPGCKPHH